MNRLIFNLAILILTLSWPFQSNAEKTYTPGKVVYDITTPNSSEFNLFLDRVSLLQKIYNNDTFDAEIILVLHEGVIPLLVKNNLKTKTLQQRAKSLALGEMIVFRVCRASAKMQGYSEKDFHSYFTLVPMADAEIIQLQHQGYAYLH